MTGTKTSKALTAWTELNDRQQGTLTVIYELDQETEAGRRRAAARGEFDSTPASVWRAIEFAHDPAPRDLFGMTELQMRLATRGWDNQGNGSTMAALAARGLIRRDWRPTSLGRMLTVALTREGRAAARAGTSTMPGRARKAALGPRPWQVLALLWGAEARGEPLKWTYSATIERVLIGKHVPPLARRSPGIGYEITERGRDFYREHYAAHVAAYPDVQAPHPDGADAEPWPARADEVLGEHHAYYRALLTAWKDAYAAHQASEQEAAADPPAIPDVLPAQVAEHIQDRHQLWRDTARQRADLASTQVKDFHEQAASAARAYAAAAITAWDAAVTGGDPLARLETPQQADPWSEERLPPPAETGVHALDAEAHKLHAAAVGTPLRRRGPAPKRRRSRYATSAPAKPTPPGAQMVALANFLTDHTRGGALVHRLHPVSG